MTGPCVHVWSAALLTGYVKSSYAANLTALAIASPCHPPSSASAPHNFVGVLEITGSLPEWAPAVQMVARRTVKLAGLLGLGLAGVLAILADPLPRLFNPSQSVMAAIRPIFGFVIVTQPLNALAFVWDGVLYGAGGFPYAATVRQLVQALCPEDLLSCKHALATWSWHPQPCLPASS